MLAEWGKCIFLLLTAKKRKLHIKYLDGSLRTIFGQQKHQLSILISTSHHHRGQIKATKNMQRCLNKFIALTLHDTLRYSVGSIRSVSLFTGAWGCSKLNPGWRRAACPLWLRWRTGCPAAPRGSPQAWWAACSWSRQTPHAARRGQCSCRPESSCRSRWTAPSKGQRERLEV